MTPDLHAVLPKPQVLLLIFVPKVAQVVVRVPGRVLVLLRRVPRRAAVAGRLDGLLSSKFRSQIKSISNQVHEAGF